MLGLADSYMRAGDAAMAEQCYTVALDSIERDYGCVLVSLVETKR